MQKFISFILSLITFAKGEYFILPSWRMWSDFGVKGWQRGEVNFWKHAIGFPPPPNSSFDSLGFLANEYREGMRDRGLR